MVQEEVKPQRRTLPPPVAREDAYLAAILEELEGLRADLADARKPAVVNVENTVELREGADATAAVEAAGQELGEELAEDALQPMPVPEKNLLQRIIGR